MSYSSLIMYFQKVIVFKVRLKTEKNEVCIELFEDEETKDPEKDVKETNKTIEIPFKRRSRKKSQGGGHRNLLLLTKVTKLHPHQCLHKIADFGSVVRRQFLQSRKECVYFFSQSRKKCVYFMDQGGRDGPLPRVRYTKYTRQRNIFLV